MYLSYNWLKRYLPTLDSVDIKTLSDKVSGSLAEVEEFIEKGKGLNNIVVGEIVKVTYHPKSKKLALAEVDTGDKVRQIVFAAKNKSHVTPGSFYPVCLPEGAIYDANGELGNQKLIEIEVKEMDGEVSEGVLCSPKEIGVLDEQTGISIISNDMQPGDNLIPLLNDYILEIENKSLTHRPDCFSHRGIAREISAIMKIDFLEKELLTEPIKTGDNPVKISVRDNKNCRRFTGISIENVNVQPSPAWMQILLSYLGTRPINNIVDISNFIMFDIGYPSHMYDIDKIDGKHLIVRKAENGEKVKALNDKTYTLDKEMTIIAGEEGVEDIAGIMGGANTEITDTTKNVYIECASWDMYNLRRTSMKLGLTSEASNRYSKGLDSYGTKDTVLRLASLIEDIAQGEIASDLDDVENEKFTERIINFNLANVSRLVGIEVEKEQMIQILESLQIEILNRSSIPVNIQNSDVFVDLKIPYFRQDLNIQQDIVEEIARIYGYENVEPKLPSKLIVPCKHNEESSFTRLIRKSLIETGLSEIYTYAFVGKDLLIKSELPVNKAIKIKNPLSPELEYMRYEVLPSLLEKVDVNRHTFDAFGYFEVSKIAIKEKNYDEIPHQPRRISGTYASKAETTDVFFTLKSKVDHLFSKLGLKVEYENLDNVVTKDIEKLLHPNKSARITIDDQIIGYIGDINPRIKNNFGYSKLLVSGFDINYDLILEKYKIKKDFEFNPIKNNQIINRDINIWIEERTESGKLIKELSQKMPKSIETIELIDIYTNTKGRKSITLRFVIGGNSEKSLDDAAINKLIDEVELIITDQMKLKLRR